MVRDMVLEALGDDPNCITDVDCEGLIVADVDRVGVNEKEALLGPTVEV